MKTLWTSRQPSSTYLGEPSLVVRPRRELAIAFAYELDDGSREEHEIVFENVVAFQVTLYPAVTGEQYSSAYETLVDMGRTEWLKQVSSAVEQGPVEASPVAHYRICYDDGPCYDVICSAVQVR